MMPSNRRLKGFFLIVVLLVLLTLYVTASARQTRSSQFYTKTQDALDAARVAKQAKLHDSEAALGEDDMITHRLKAAEEAAKRNADKKGDEFHGEETKQKVIKVKESLEEVDEEKKLSSKSKSSKSFKSDSKSSSGGSRYPEEGEKGVAGRKIIKDNVEKVLKGEPIKEAEAAEEDEEDDKKPHEETEDELKAHAELNDILKKSPSIFTHSHLTITIVLTKSFHSNNILQNILPLLSTRQTHSPREIQNHTTSLRCGIGYSSTGQAIAILLRWYYGAQNCA
jgi:FtsZ-interacting cell division protein ZipA